MTQLNVAADESTLAILRERLRPATFAESVRNAVARTTSRGANQFEKRVQGTLNIAKKYTNRAIYHRVRDQSGTAVGTITVDGKSLPLIAYNPRSTKRNGVQVQQKRNGPVSTLRHAFVSTVSGAGGNAGGHRGVFGREKHLPTKGPNKGKGRIGKSGYAGRLAIGEYWGPSIASAFGAVRLTEMGKEEIANLGETLKFELASQLSRALTIKATDARAILGVAEPAK